jgi:phage tail tape-measure protein
MATQWTAGLTSGATLSANTLNTIGAAWENWTPVLSASVTNPNLGTTSTKDGRYCRINKTIIAQANFTFGGAGITAGSGFYKCSLPFAAITAAPTIGSVVAIDVSTFASTINIVGLDTTTLAIGYGTGGASLAASIQAGTYPWATGDILRWFMIYEAA